MSDPTPNNTNPTDEFLDTLGDTPQATRKLKLPEVIPVIRRGPGAGANGAGEPAANADCDGAGEAEATPLEGSDAEAYAALKAKRAERRRKKLVRRGIAIGVVVAVVAGGAIAINALNKEPEQMMEAVTDFAVQGDFETAIDAKGTLQPLSATVITPEVSGQIESVNVVAGQAVNAGDVLMTIKNPELDRAVAEADRALRQARADLAAAQQALAEAQRLASQPTGDPMSGPAVDVAGAQQAVNAAQVAVESAQAAYGDATAKAALRTVKAPAAGSIVAMNAQVGADLADSMGASGAGGPLMQIADLSKMKVTIQVEEKDIASVAVDQTATITCPAFPDLTMTGRVTAIASIASGDGAQMSYDGMGGSPTFAVDIMIDAPDARLKPGMTAEVSLITQKLENVVMVPITALLTDDGQNYYVNLESDPETHAMKRLDVRVVAQNDDYAVVGKPADAPAEQNADMPESPLSDSDVLVIAGGMMPEDEMAGGGASGGMEVR